MHDLREGVVALSFPNPYTIFTAVKPHNLGAWNRLPEA